VAALDLARAGHNVALATGTASGKSLCYQLLIADAIRAQSAGSGQPPGTALLVFPTKALAQDQLRALGDLGVPGLVPVTYDGDSTPEDRAWARRHANALLTNPDMLHVGILPSHERWAGFLCRLRYVVVDELHTLRGVYGTHVAHVLRRLRRLCAHHGAAPSFVFCSATIGQPGALASAVCGLDVTEVLTDASPRGARSFGLWNPVIVDAPSGVRASAHTDTAKLLAAYVESGHRVIAFTRSRRGAEVVAARTRDLLPVSLASAVRPYRGGYLAEERRALEAELFAGRLLGVAATSALELGVDVGGLDVAILDGFPGTIASMWQQAGRVGRALQESLTVLVAGPDALDQWFMAHPTELFRRPPEPAVINPANPFVLGAHLTCAAYELPLSPRDAELWGDALDDGVRELVRADRLVVRAGAAVYAGRSAPAAGVGLRSGWAEEYQIVDDAARLIGTVDASRVFETVHPGAIYLHQGQHYLVEHLDPADRVAWVTPADGDEWTQARTRTELRIICEDRAQPLGRLRLCLGGVEVTNQVTGYARRRSGSGEVLGTVELDLPPSRLVTRAFWYGVDPGLIEDADLVPGTVPGTLHAAEHAGIGILPLFTICDRSDVGGVSTPSHPQTGLPTVFVYDGYPGGAGIAELGFAAGRRYLESTLEVIVGCPCDTGCPSCIQSPKCGNWNEPLDKAGAVALLRAVLCP